MVSTMTGTRNRHILCATPCACGASPCEGDMLTVRSKRHIPILLAALLACSCIDQAPEGLAPSQFEEGAPMVIFDPNAKPLPEIPLPNDVATRLDANEPFTGRRINVSFDAPTAVERDVRRRAELNNGFGTYSPITVSFTRPLDLWNIVDRHQRNTDFSDDAIYLVDVTPGSPTYLKPTLLDLGRGNFPVTLKDYDMFFLNDPRSMSTNVLLETEEEDTNGNGILDPGEDTDFDGNLDHPNVHPEGAAPEDGLLTWYEKETNTLIVRPVVPLRQETTYAVVLTRRLVGETGIAVASPFPFVNHAMQTAALKPLKQALAHNNWGLDLGDIAFTWTFTTQSVTRVLEAVRDGLYGQGKLGWIADRFPLHDFSLSKIRGGKAQPGFVAVIDEFIDGLAPLAIAAVDDPDAADAMIDDLRTIDYLVAGRFRTPFFLEDTDGIATPDYPADEDESFDINLQTGEAVVGERWVPFICAIPKKADKCANGRDPVKSTRTSCDKEGKCQELEIERCTPYPVVIYIHGYGGMRYEALGFAGRHAKFGLATCAIDAHAHGVDLTTLTIKMDETTELKVGALLEPFATTLNLPGLLEVLKDNRARDLNNDGIPDPAGDFWTYDVFHTRDVVRQTVVDHMQFIRLLRTFNGDNVMLYDTNGDGKPELAGDFDGDGQVDLGGTQVKYFAWGQSMGGIIAPVLGAVDPVVRAIAPAAGGGGLFDLAMRSTNPGVPEAVFIPLFGPFVVSEPQKSGKVLLSFLLQDMEDNFPIQAIHPIHEAELKPGDRVVLKNLVNGEKDEIIVPADLKFRLSVPADALVASEKRVAVGINEDASNAPVPTMDTLKLGDALQLELYSGPTDLLSQRISQFGFDVSFHGVTYQAGAPLVSPAIGFGMKRGTPKLRRFLAFASMFIEPGDPVAYAPHLFLDPLVDDQTIQALHGEETDLLQPETNALFIPTAGDTNVPVNSEIAQARAGGVIEYLKAGKDYCVTGDMCPDSLSGKSSPVCDFIGKCLTENQVIALNYAYEGLYNQTRFDTPPWNDPREVLFDLDDLDDGKMPWATCTRANGEPYPVCMPLWEEGLTCVDGPDAPDLRDWGWEPLRATTDNGKNGMRLFMGYITDCHGFDPPMPQWAVNMTLYYANLVSNYFYQISRSNEPTSKTPWLPSHLCMADDTCPWFPF